MSAQSNQNDQSNGDDQSNEDEQSNEGNQSNETDQSNQNLIQKKTGNEIKKSFSSLIDRMEEEMNQLDISVSKWENIKEQIQSLASEAPDKVTLDIGI